ncbi:TIGR04222 domain-containing membrane protein [Streptomyces hydrogenans]|uniref:TIGR04222 domain-containing membrane protein n=1 Tax=Streptomyces hydrogenans TaxID=1873719 RepID=UPI00366406E4
MNAVDLLLFAFYLAGAAAVTRLVVLARRGRGGAGGPVRDVYEAAFLCGGPGRVADTALAAMHLDGRIVIGGPGVVAVVRRTAHDPVERAVLDLHAAAPSGSLRLLRLGVMTHPAVQEIGDDLAARGLLTVPGPRRVLRRWCVGVALAAFLMMPVSAVITVVEFSSPDGPSVPFFVKLLPLFFVCFVTALVCGTTSTRRVGPAGIEALAAYRRAYGHGGVNTVALGGIRALSDRDLWERLREAGRPQGPGVPGGARTSSSSSDTSAAAAVVLWCGGAATGGGDGWGSDSGSGSGSGCGGGGSSCSSSSCGSSSSSCGSSSSSCGSSSSSSCGSSGGSSCGSSG